MLHFAKTILVALCVLPISSASACTTFVARAGNELFYGRNLDYGYDFGLVVVNKRGVHKTAFVPPQLQKPILPAKWTSKYGSVIASAIGREFPSSGINEAGLTISEMTLNDSRYPPADDRPAVNVLQWIQYQLDNSNSVEEVLSSDSQLRVFPLNSRGHHYLVCDASGSVVTIEFLDGMMKVYRRDTLAAPVLTNSTCDASLDYLKKYVGFGGNEPIPISRSSLDRYVRAASLVKGFETSENKVDAAFGILAHVAQGESTKWSLVFDVTRRRLYFRTRSYPKVKSIDLTTLDLRSNTPTQILDMNRSGEGNVTTELANYTADDQRTFFLRLARDNKEVQQSGDPNSFVEFYVRYLSTLDKQATQR